MMQTTRICRLDRLVRKGDPGERVRVIYTFNWHEDEQTAPLGGHDANDSRAATGDDPAVNSGWAAQGSDGERSL